MCPASPPQQTDALRRSAPGPRPQPTSAAPELQPPQESASPGSRARAGGEASTSRQPARRLAPLAAESDGRSPPARITSDRKPLSRFLRPGCILPGDFGPCRCGAHRLGRPRRGAGSTLPAWARPGRRPRLQSGTRQGSSRSYASSNSRPRDQRCDAHQPGRLHPRHTRASLLTCSRQLTAPSAHCGRARLQAALPRLSRAGGEQDPPRGERVPSARRAGASASSRRQRPSSAEPDLQGRRWPFARAKPAQLQPHARLPRPGRTAARQSPLRPSAPPRLRSRSPRRDASGRWEAPTRAPGRARPEADHSHAAFLAFPPRRDAQLGQPASPASAHILSPAPEPGRLGEGKLTGQARAGGRAQGKKKALARCFCLAGNCASRTGFPAQSLTGVAGVLPCSWARLGRHTAPLAQLPRASWLGPQASLGRLGWVAHTARPSRSSCQGVRGRPSPRLSAAQIARTGLRL